MEEGWVPVPEIVEHHGIEIARFEVTRAQFKVFDKNYAVPQGTENYPANNISLDRAKSYASWLSKSLGQELRLPYEDEVKALYENRENENTLDYWAGYSPNPEDTSNLRLKAALVSGAAPLLKEVGSFAGKGKDDEEPIYDLGGNVAEWVLTRDGKGKLIGGIADCPADPKANCTAAPEYVGFRVVRGAAKPAAH
jgi:formylglycine-generating enzyme required for sulfatase activity